MAQIPREHRKELPPVVPTQGIAGQMIGKAVEKSGKDIAMMGDALLKAHRVSVFNRKMSQAAIDLTKMQERAVDDTDYPTMGERYSEEMASYREEMLTGITDPTLHELVSRRFDELSTQKMVNIRSYARKGIVAEGEASVLASVDAYLDAMINSGTEQERAKYWAMAEGAIKGGVAAGYYYADKAEAMLQKADRTRQVKEVEHDVIKYGSEKVMNSLYGKGPFTYNLDDDIRLDLRASVTAEYNRQKQMALEASADWDTNPQVWGDLYFRLVNPKPGEQRTTIDEVEAAFQKRLLKIEHVKQFRQMIESGVFDTVWYKNADGMLKNLFGYNAVMGIFADPQDSQRYYYASAEFMNRVNTEGLQGQDLLNAAMEIAQPYLTQMGGEKAEEILKEPTWFERGFAQFQFMIGSPYAKIKLHEREEEIERRERILGERLPPADEHKDEVAVDAVTGEVRISNGKEWLTEEEYAKQRGQE